MISRTWTRFMVALVMMLALTVGFTTAQAQTGASDNVSIQAGVTNVGGVNTFTGTVEVQKTLGSDRVLLDNLTTFQNGDESQTLSNTALLRVYPYKRVFVAGGVTFGRPINISERRFDGDTFLNPTFQAGATIDASERLQFEPYVQLDTSDLLNNGNTQSLTAALTTSIALSKRVGITGDVGIFQTRGDYNFFRNGRIEKFGTVGLYFNF